MAAEVEGRTRLDASMDVVAAVCLVAEELGDRCGAIAFDDEIRTAGQAEPPRLAPRDQPALRRRALGIRQRLRARVLAGRAGAPRVRPGAHRHRRRGSGQAADGRDADGGPPPRGRGRERRRPGARPRDPGRARGPAGRLPDGGGLRRPRGPQPGGVRGSARSARRWSRLRPGRWRPPASAPTSRRRCARASENDQASSRRSRGEADHQRSGQIDRAADEALGEPRHDKPRAPCRG